MSPQPPPEGISQSAWDEAVATVGEWGPAIGLDGEVEEPIVTESIARSIMAATERERERCAVLVETMAVSRGYAGGMPRGDTLIKRTNPSATAQLLAAAIRQGSQPSNAIPLKGVVR